MRFCDRLNLKRRFCAISAASRDPLRFGPVRPWMLANHCFEASLRFDGWGARRLVSHSEHTRAVFAPETFPLPDRTQRELGYDPHGNVTRWEIRRTAMWNNVTWNGPLPLRRLWNVLMFFTVWRETLPVVCFTSRHEKNIMKQESIKGKFESRYLTQPQFTFSWFESSLLYI